MLKTPVIVLNVKTYAEATGDKALDIAMLMDKISEEMGVSMSIAVQATDITMCAEKIGIPVFAYFDTIIFKKWDFLGYVFVCTIEWLLVFIGYSIGNAEKKMQEK